METLPHPREPADATAAAYPRWVLLNWYGSRRGDASVVADARTVADSYTSTGWPFRVSFGLTPPPANSCLNYGWLGGGPPGGDRNDRPTVIAAHGDCVLFELMTPHTHCDLTCNFDYFLYEAGAVMPPSLSLLPARYIPKQYERRGGEARRRRRREDSARPRMLHENDTVLLRRCEGEILVVQFEVSNEETEAWNDDEAKESNDDEAKESNDDEPKVSKEPRINAELCVLRLGRGVWELMQAVPIVHDEMASSGEGFNKLMRQWETDAAIPVGDRFLCFVDYLRGMFLCDTADMESPLTLRYVPLPVVPPDHIWSDERGCLRRSRNLSAAGACAVRFARIEPRCCCGGPGRTWCARGRFAFTVTTWTLSLPTEDGEPSATCVKDGVLDCEELWAFPAYDGLPRVRLEYPIVSSDDPDVVCFTVCEDHCASSSEKKVWMVEVNTRSKELLSAIPCTTDPWRAQSNVAAKLRW